MKVLEIVEQQPSLSVKELYLLPASDATKIIKSSQFSWTPGEWSEVRNGEWENKSGDSISFHSTTTRSMTGRLREPSKTKYLVYVILFLKGGGQITVDFGSARGENSASDEKIKNIKTKVLAWAKKAFGIDLSEFDFKY